MEGTVKDCFTELSSIAPSILNHTFVEWKQQIFFRKCTQDMSDGEITEQIDFAEIYAVKEQDEIQSAHQSNKQITIVTGTSRPEPGRSTLYLSTICRVLGMYSSTFLGNLQYVYLYLSTFQMYFDFHVLLEYI